jgi:hypothetical protein
VVRLKASKFAARKARLSPSEENLQSLKLEPLNSKRTTGRYCSWLDTLRFAPQRVNTMPVISCSRAKPFKKMTAIETSRDTNALSFAKCRAFFETDWLYISSQLESKQDRMLPFDSLIPGGW